MLSKLSLHTHRVVSAFIAGTALMIVFSCSADDAGRGESPLQREAIVFSAQEGTTRTAPNTLTLDGSGTNEASLKTDGFGVFAATTGFHPYVSSTVSCDLLWNQPVTYDDALSQWTYSPVAYWPNTDEELTEYVTFFAYAPYSDGTDPDGCIVDFSLPGETGDPWLVYQLGGSTTADGANGWKAKQRDLLYDFRKDQQRPYPPTAARVVFSFKHALACVGDRITLTCSDALQTELKELAASTGTTVTLTVERLALDYRLTAKARLVLNSSTTPNWKTVESGEPQVHRYLVLNAQQVIATATSGTSCTLTDYAANDQGIFYIPLETGGHAQQVTATVYYRLSTGDEGILKSTTTLSSVAAAGDGRSLHFVLNF